MENMPVFPSFDARIKAQVELWRRHSSEAKEKPHLENQPFFTISRQFGCPAFPFAKLLGEKLKVIQGRDYVVYDRKLIEWVCEERNVSKNLMDSLNKRIRGEIEDWIVGLFSGEASEMSAFRNLAFAVKAIAAKGHSIMIGRGSSLITSGMKNGFHIRLVAPLQWRINYFKDHYPERTDLANESAFLLIDQQREGFVKKYLSSDLTDPSHYHLTINTALLNLEKGVALAAALIQEA